MIDFVLEQTRKPAFGRDTNGLAAHILPLDQHFAGPTDILAHIARDAQTALGPQLFPLGLDDLWIEYCNLVIFILGDEKADGEGDLRRSKANALRLVHRLEHVVNESLQRWIEAMNLFRLLAQYRVFCGDDFAKSHFSAYPYTTFKRLTPNLGHAASLRML